MPPRRPMANQVCVHAHVHAGTPAAVQVSLECVSDLVESRDCAINERLQVVQYSVFVL